MPIAKIIDDNTIEVYDLTQFDVDAIMHSGQVFRYFAIENGYQLIVGNHFADIVQDKNDNKIIIKCDNSTYFYNYFDFDTDYNAIKNSLSEYKKMIPAIKAGDGIRILKGEFVEMVLSFIISANNNIKRFTKTLNLLAERYGDKLAYGKYAFPALKQLKNVTEADFKELGCGYRSVYLVKAIEQLKNINIEQLKKLSNKELQKALCQITGIGPKVANCVMLFCGDFNRLDIAPQDTWINKALEQLGDDGEVLLNHKYAGIAQQYIFYFLQYLRKEI
ncbi:MAG: hypothetical protein FWD82_00070 [Defluviitaleaceae bacterium]|nr:hypothetical protein [Defluviitaleaceae bacterium]